MQIPVDKRFSYSEFQVETKLHVCYRCQKRTRAIGIRVNLMENRFLCHVVHFEKPSFYFITDYAKKYDLPYFYDYSKTIDRKFWMNHCEVCEAKVGDHFLFVNPHASFKTDPSVLSEDFNKIIEGTMIVGESFFGF